MDLMEKYLSRVKSEGRKRKLNGREIIANAESQKMMAEGIEEVTYTFDEVSQMIDEGISKEGLVAIQKIKKAFLGSTVEAVSNEDRN